MSKQSTNTTPDGVANNQPTVNERLDEIIRRAYHGEVSWIHDQLDGTSFIGESLRGVEKNIIDTKQALTSLIKELVEEAKPHYTSEPNHNFGTTHETGMSEGYNLAIDEFEQNLLKALEEV